MTNEQQIKVTELFSTFCHGVVLSGLDCGSRPGLRWLCPICIIPQLNIFHGILKSLVKSKPEPLKYLYIQLNGSLGFNKKFFQSSGFSPGADETHSSGNDIFCEFLCEYLQTIFDRMLPFRNSFATVNKILPVDGSWCVTLRYPVTHNTTGSLMICIMVTRQYNARHWTNVSLINHHTVILTRNYI